MQSRGTVLARLRLIGNSVRQLSCHPRFKASRRLCALLPYVDMKLLRHVMKKGRPPKTWFVDVHNLNTSTHTQLHNAQYICTHVSFYISIFTHHIA